MSPKNQVVQPLGWVNPRGYANGIVAEGRILFIAGQVGWNPRLRSPTFPRSFSAQFTQALDNVLAVLREAGGTPRDLVRLTVYITDLKEYLSARNAIGVSWQRRVGRYFPAMSLVEVSALLERGAKVELEATAVLSADGR